MREVKFRAWDELNQNMITDYEWIMDNFYNCNNMSGLELMQFTGLKDRNGKEIYEGDILEFTLDKTFGVVTTFGKANNLGVEWENNKTTIFTPLFYMQCEKELNILGNIYETPELLSK